MEGELPEDGLATYGDDLIMGVGGAGYKWEQDDGWKSVEVHTNGANGHGHDDEVPEPQRLPFSWAEFMAEEPAKPKGRSRKPQPAWPSLFEMARTHHRSRRVALGRYNTGRTPPLYLRCPPPSGPCVRAFCCPAIARFFLPNYLPEKVKSILDIFVIAVSLPGEPAWAYSESDSHSMSSRSAAKVAAQEG